jgi:hypothetical protein
MLQKDNMRSRAELEREVTQRQGIQLQLESKDDLIKSLKSQMESRAYQLLLEQGRDVVGYNLSSLLGGSKNISTKPLLNR